MRKLSSFATCVTESGGYRKMKIKEIEKQITSRLRDLFSARPSQKSKMKITEAAKQIRRNKWTADTIDDYIEFSYNGLLKIRDRYKKSNVNYFVAIMSNKENMNYFVDFNKEQYKVGTEDQQDETAVSYKGRDFNYLDDIDDFGEIYFHEDIEKERFIFVVRDLSGPSPKLMFLKAFNEEFPDRAISRKAMVAQAKTKDY